MFKYIKYFLLKLQAESRSFDGDMFCKHVFVFIILLVMTDDKLKKMRKFIKRINYLCFSKRNLITKFGVFLFVVAFGIFIVANPVFAEDWLSSVKNGLLQGIAWIFLVLANFFIALTIFALRYFVEVAAYNHHTLAPTVILGWTMVRDVANMFFVVILLAIAFGTILGLDQYEWKKLTVKLVLAAIFINFSKLIAGIIIDAAHVFTITFLNAIVATAGGNIINMFGLQKMMTFAGSAMNNPSEEDLVVKVLGGSVAAFLFSFIALLTIGAYTAIMLSRMLILWVLIILSPLAYLMSVLPATKKYASDYWQEFIKYVIAGPVMVFFLWLAFATMGSGKVNQEIASSVGGEEKGFAISNKTTAAGTRESEISASLSAVTEWESMASFFIAVAFLFVGLQQVSKLGLVGGTLAGQVSDLGKKTAMKVTGATAAGWLGGKALGKALAVSGAVLKGAGKLAISPVNRTARELKARAAVKIRGVQTAMADKAGELEKKGYFGKIGAQFMEIGTGRKEAKVAKWEDAAEKAKTKLDKSLHTTETPGGQANARLSMDLKIIEETKAKNREKSEMEMYEKRMATEPKFREQEEKNFGLAATVERKQMEQRQEKELSIAQARDKEALANDEFTGYVEATEAKHFKEKMDQIISPDFSRNIMKVEGLDDQISKLQGDLVVTGDSNEQAEIQLQLNHKQKQKDTLQAALMGKGGFYAMAALDAGTKRFPKGVSADKIKGQQARFLSDKLNRDVGENEVEAAFDEWKSRYSPNKFSALMTHNVDALESSAQDGAIGNAGLFKGEIDKVSGATNYSLTDEVSDKDFIKNRRDYARQQMDFRKPSALSGGLDIKVDVSGKKQVRIDTDEAMENTISMFGGITKNQVSSVNSGNLDELNALFENHSQSVKDFYRIGELIRGLREKVTSLEDVKALLARTNLEKIQARLLTNKIKVKDNNGNLVDLY